MAVCASCGSNDIETSETPPYCNDCGEEQTEDATEDVAPTQLIVVGLILESEPVPKKDKLTQLKVDVGHEEVLQLVSNAKNLDVGKRIVVAKVGASVAGSEEPVRKANVGGAVSHGMVCDGPMLGWVGGGAGAAVFLPDAFSPGDAPPAERPRPN